MIARTPADIRERIRWMRTNGWSREATARAAGVCERTVSRIIPIRRVITDEQVRTICELRADGYSIDSVAARLDLSASVVRRHAPGRPGKVPVAPLREAFLDSGVPLAEVARRLGWASRGAADGSRVARTLGLRPDISGSNGVRTTRTLVDAEIVGNIAEAIGISPWAVLPDDEDVAA